MMNNDVWYKYYLVTINSLVLSGGGVTVMIAYTYPVKCIGTNPIRYSKMIEKLRNMYVTGWQYSLGSEREVNKEEFEEFMLVTNSGKNMFEF